MRPLRLLAIPALLGLAVPAARAASADISAPSVSNFQITDCEGTFQDSQLITSTGTPDVRIRVQDVVVSSPTLAGMGLRLKRTQHIGGTAAATNLVALLHFDASFVSSETYANNGTNLGTGACGSGNGHTGLAGDDCRVWSAVGNEVRLNASASLNSTTAQMTLQAWINPTSNAAAPILEYNDGANSGPHLWHGVNNSGDLYANLIDTRGASHVIVSSGGFVHASQWQLVTLTYNGSTAKLFHNEVMIASASFTSLPPLATAKDLSVGFRRGPANTFAGNIDEVRVLNTAISDDQVEGDIYGGLFLFKTTTSASVPMAKVFLDPAVHYTPASPAYGFQSPATATVTGVKLVPGSGNQLVFSFQDTVGNNRRSSFGITVINSVPDQPLSLAGDAAATDTINWSWTRGLRLCLFSGGAGRFKGYRPSDKALLYGPSAAAAFSQGSLGPNSLNALAVSALDDFGESELTAATSVYTRAAAPTAFAATGVTTGSAVVGWGSANPGYTRFEVTVSQDNFASPWSTAAAFTDDMTAVSLGLAGLAAQTTYFVRVRAMNGRSSDVTTVGTLFTSALSGQFATLPAAPGTLSAAPQGVSSILWSWSAVPTATSYTLESSTGTNLAVTGGLSHTTSNLTPNTAYGARLKADNPSGGGSFGAFVNTFTNADAPTLLVVTSVATATVRLDWNGGANPGGTSYIVQITTDSGFSTVLSAVSAVGTGVSLSGLLQGTTYQARVAASGLNGTRTAFSNQVSFVTGRFSAVSSTSAPPTPYAFRPETVAAWHFDEASGTRAADASLFGNHGALSAVVSGSTPAFVTGQTGLNGAVRFPGIVESVMTVPHSASLAGTGDLAVEAWVSPAAVSQVQDAGLVVKGAGGDETFMLDVNSTGRWRFAVRDGAGALSAVLSTQSLRLGTWTHLAGVYASAGSLSIYVDGALSATAAAPASRRVTAGSLSIGNRRSGATSFDRAFRGDVDEVHIETAALSAAQVAADYAASRPAEVIPPAPNDGTRLTVPPNAFGGAAVILVSSSPSTVPIRISPAILADGLSAPPTGQTLVPGSVYEIVANVGGQPFVGNLGSTVTVGLPYPDADGNRLVDGTFPPIPVESLRMYTLNAAVTRWESLPSTVDLVNKRVLGQTGHFSVFALFGPTGIRPDTTQVRLYPRPWRPGSGTSFDSVTFGGRTGLAIDNLTTSGIVRILALAGELVRELPFGPANSGTLIWDGTNAAGRSVASGVYFAYVKPDDGSTVVIKFAVER